MQHVHRKRTSSHQIICDQGSIKWVGCIQDIQTQHPHILCTNTGSCIILCVVDTYIVMSVWWNLTLSIHVHSDCMLLCKIIVSEQFLMHGIWYFGTCSIQWFKRVLLFFFLYVRKPPDLEATWSKALLCMPSVNQTVPVQPIRLYHSEIQFWPHSSERCRKLCLAVVSFLLHVVGHRQSQITYKLWLWRCVVRL